MRPVPPPPPPKLSTAPSPLPPLPPGPTPPPPVTATVSAPSAVGPALPVLDPGARYGLAGEIVAMIEPYTESDPAALLSQLLTLVGIWVGLGPHVTIGADRHTARLFTAVVGDSATGRKGEALSQVRRVVRLCDPAFDRACVQTGLSTGEGLIEAVCDPRGKKAGVEDKRLLMRQPEFATVMLRARRSNNTLSATLREAWDQDDLAVRTRSNPVTATGCHIGMIAHVTPYELPRVFSTTEQANGLGNRILWVWSARAKLVDDPSAPSEAALRPLLDRLTLAVEVALGVGEVKLTSAARDLNRHAYRAHFATPGAGMVGAMTARAGAISQRLALIFALLDGCSTPVIDVPHLRAAFAVCRYGEDSVRYILGSETGDETADMILEALGVAAAAGLTRRQIRDLFHRHRRLSDIEHALRGLEAAGMARRGILPTDGRHAEIWYTTAGAT